MNKAGVVSSLGTPREPLVHRGMIDGEHSADRYSVGYRGKTWGTYNIFLLFSDNYVPVIIGPKTMMQKPC